MTTAASPQQWLLGEEYTGFQFVLSIGEVVNLDRRAGFRVSTPTRTMSDELKVKVPTAPKSTEETSRAIDEIIINAREEDGDLIITIDREVFTREKLHAMLQRMITVNPNQPVRIRGDAQMSWQRMADVISTCSQAGVWNVSFSKQMPETKK